ncbi:hypothetical protein HYT26_00420 [Candidatus Pacearchaeota archaeon]|nr:hypothetical protein [Candidatus Pacearchaeota archaeon]
MSYRKSTLDKEFPKKEPLHKEVIDKLKHKSLFWLWFWAISPLVILAVLIPTLKPKESYIDYFVGVLGILLIYFNGRDLYRYYKYIKRKI